MSVLRVRFIGEQVVLSMTSIFADRIREPWSCQQVVWATGRDRAGRGTAAEWSRHRAKVDDDDDDDGQSAEAQTETQTDEERERVTRWDGWLPQHHCVQLGNVMRRSAHFRRRVATSLSLSFVRSASAHIHRFNILIYLFIIHFARKNPTSLQMNRHCTTAGQLWSSYMKNT